MYVPPIRMVYFGSLPIRMVPPGVTFLHLAEQFVFIVLAFHEYYKEKCMSHSAIQGNCLGLISYYKLKKPKKCLCLQSEWFILGLLRGLFIVGLSSPLGVLHAEPQRAPKNVCMCVQSEWFIMGLSDGSPLGSSGGTVCVYSTGIPIVL